LSTAFVLRRGDDLGVGLTIWISGALLRMAVVSFVLGVMPVLDIMVAALLVFHDVVDGARGRTRSRTPNDATTHVPRARGDADVVVCVAGAPVPVKVGAEVAIVGAVRQSLLGVVLIDLLLDGREVAVCRSIGSTARMET
jgi:hypothetical protein